MDGCALLPLPAPAAHRGFFVAVEGGDGAGKSTQVAALVAHLRAAGRAVLRTREPGGTPVAEAVRALLLDPASAGLDARAEALLFAAARADHVARLVRPALDRGDVVVTDRYQGSSVAYQGWARGLGADAVAGISRWATGDLRPDLTVVLDLDPAVGLCRAADAGGVGAADRMESEPLAFHAGVRAAFLRMAADDPARHRVLDAARPVAAVTADVLAAVDAALGARA